MNDESTTEGDQLVSEALTAQDDDIVNQIFQKEFFSSSFDVAKSGKFLQTVSTPEYYMQKKKPKLTLRDKAAKQSLNIKTNDETYQ